MEKFRRSRIARFFYDSPRLVSTYHFLWAWLGALWYRLPGRKIFVIGVTGTKGKTTTVELLNAMLEAAGKKTALLSSLRIKIGETSEKNPGSNSMPGRARIQRFLAEAVRAGCRYAIIEVTSQGVTQHRHRFINWRIAALTNLAPEHIESHGSFENYRQAKLDFLNYVLARGGRIFLNRDDQHFGFFSNALSAREMRSYSAEDERIEKVLAEVGEPSFARRASAPRFVLTHFNAQNAAAAVAIAMDLEVDEAAIVRALTSFRGVPGRMEFLTEGPYTAIVDYAHTPDSLKAAYAAAKPKPNANYPDARLICILGAAGGGRDKWKRPEFGKIAATYCDEIILTDEDPYDEDPAEIIREIRAGISDDDLEYVNVYEILNRREAVKKAFALMRAGDVVIGTGKGSEDWIHVARGEKIPWNERQAFEEALEEKDAVRSAVL
ncbi:MAG: UDP-N-acetylmuramyl-tripeptide synthetase [Minisyncoccia bacterium]